jgi:hypothetical protein
MPATRLRSAMHIRAVRYLVKGVGKALVWRAAVNIRALLTAKICALHCRGRGNVPSQVSTVLMSNSGTMEKQQHLCAG